MKNPIFLDHSHYKYKIYFKYIKVVSFLYKKNQHYCSKQEKYVNFQSNASFNAKIKRQEDYSYDGRSLINQGQKIELNVFFMV